MVSRGLDHIVHATHDLDAAGEAYRRLGFTVGARNAHPWGTHNRIVQFPGFFIELLSIGEPEKITPQRGEQFSFGAFNRDFLKRREGFSMLVLESRDAEADARDFAAAGIEAFAPFRFERAGRRPDGSETRVAFTLAFARDKHPMQAGFFVCQQHYPENFWNPAFQQHANGAIGVAGAVLVAERPPDHGAFLAAFAGASAPVADRADVRVQTPRGEIAVVEPAAFRDRFGVEPPDVSDGAQIAALRLTVADLAAVRAHLDGAGVAFREDGASLIVAPGEAAGAALILEPR